MTSILGNNNNIILSSDKSNISIYVNSLNTTLLSSTVESNNTEVSFINNTSDTIKIYVYDDSSNLIVILTLESGNIKYSYLTSNKNYKIYVQKENSTYSIYSVNKISDTNKGKQDIIYNKDNANNDTYLSIFLDKPYTITINYAIIDINFSNKTQSTLDFDLYKKNGEYSTLLKNIKLNPDSSDIFNSYTGTYILISKNCSDSLKYDIFDETINKHYNIKCDTSNKSNVPIYLERNTKLIISLDNNK